MNILHDVLDALEMSVADTKRKRMNTNVISKSSFIALEEQANRLNSFLNETPDYKHTKVLEEVLKGMRMATAFSKVDGDNVIAYDAYLCLRKQTPILKRILKGNENKL